VAWMQKDGLMPGSQIQADALKQPQNANLTGACVISNYPTGAPPTTQRYRRIGRVAVDTQNNCKQVGTGPCGIMAIV
jgi:hypothetical protein